MKLRNFLLILAVLVLITGCSRNDSGVSVSQTPAPPPSQVEGGDVAEVPEVVVLPDTSPEPEEEEGNTPPEIRKVWFVAGDGSAGNGIGVEFETFDADGDTVNVEIEWRKNGEPAGTGKYIQSEIRRDDNITVTITPSDGKAAGRAVNLSRKIANSPPSIQGHNQFQFEEGVVFFQILASDSDEDTLSYALKDAPVGMTIDRDTGKIRWAVPPETTGKIMFTVEVSDGSGGSATASLSITVAPQSYSEAQ